METPTSDNHRLLAALCYPLSPILGVILLLIESTKGDPFVKPHAVQSIALGVVLLIVGTVSTFIPFLGCVVLLLAIAVTIYYAVQTYQLKAFEIPVVTNFCKQQGWI
ncbi:MAG: hypothetical protein RMM31_00500 [Anaerolineae bacterium]|nr:hypothetical protein [Anaerolineae bacterium]